MDRDEIGKMIDATNAGEALRRFRREIIKTRRGFPKRRGRHEPCSTSPSRTLAMRGRRPVERTPAMARSPLGFDRLCRDWPDGPASAKRGKKRRAVDRRPAVKLGGTGMAERRAP